MKSSLLASAVVLGSISLNAMAHSNQSCNIEFDKDLVISKSSVQLQDNGNTLWQISDDGQLILNGEPVTVNNDTRLLLRDYQAGIRSQTLETVALVEDALIMASEALTTVLSELTGKSLDDYPAMQQALTKINDAADQVVVQDGDNTYLYGSRLDSIDQAFGPEFEQAIEDAVSQSMGSIMMLVGKAMTSGEGSFEQRMEAFGEKMEKFGENLEAKMDIKAAALEQRGDAICSQVSQLDALETRIQQQIPAMQQYDLFKNGDSSLSLRR
ncbi:Protein of unknown function [Arsukibacterium tuosuense]|uniref:DUF2884 domain-containing protein n=1 Tax=Arsukibacterium tuosuense TaxID=1323745 RepID=A0A285IQS4_9GAMM|nr:DUF2884 family protein [Arsukibacterium tuosuense]SNY49311.1 Protein of unknown function [Arsukibacterium tuosuense]